MLTRTGFSAFACGVLTLRACVVALMDGNPSAKSLDVLKRIIDHFLAAPFDGGAQASFVTGQAYPALSLAQRFEAAMTFDPLDPRVTALVNNAFQAAVWTAVNAVGKRTSPEGEDGTSRRKRGKVAGKGAGTGAGGAGNASKGTAAAAAAAALLAPPVVRVPPPPPSQEYTAYVTDFNQKMKALGIKKEDMVCWKFAAGLPPCNGVQGQCRVDTRRKHEFPATMPAGNLAAVSALAAGYHPPAK
jgi:hypothetical protein